MIPFDLRSGYHHIELNYHVFTVSPSGLCSATYIFTTFLKPLEKYWRLQSIQIALFAHDGQPIEFFHERCLALAKAPLHEQLLCDNLHLTIFISSCRRAKLGNFCVANTFTEKLRCKLYCDK